MKELASFEKEVGGDGAKAKGALIVEDGMLKLKAELGYPLTKVIEPVQKVVNDLVDKLEAMIPGDQVAMAAQAKADAKAAIDKLLSEI